MIVFDENNQDSHSQTENRETVFQARAVSRGFAAGRVVKLDGNQRQLRRLDLPDSELENELFRFRAAVRHAKNQLKNINTQQTESAGQNKAGIFDAHLLILEDDFLLSKIENTIRIEKINSEWAIKQVMDVFLSDYKNAARGSLQERSIDLVDITERLQDAFVKNVKSKFVLEKNSIIVAKTITPSVLIELAKTRPQAVITEKGGWTSHTFILAREMNLPAVTGLKEITRRVRTGDEIIVDGYSGKVVLHPKKETAKKFKREAVRFRQGKPSAEQKTKSPLKTLDGREITIRANIDLPKGYRKAENYGAQGIGLYRSEFLFDRDRGFPLEREQIKAYEKLAKLVGGLVIRIRTFDLTIEQMRSENTEKEPNAALGLRGIRLGLSLENEFRVQLRALLQASAACRIDVILPMVSDISEILRTKKILEEEKSDLRKQKIKFGNPRIGAMIEVPATILNIEEIAETVDFLCLGTNDLVQYLLAVDRDNESVADWFRTLHPAVLRAIKKVIQAADASEIPVAICGEMAGSPVYAAVLVGLGATELSMNPNSIPRVRNTLTAIAFEEAKAIAEQLLQCKTSDASEQLVSELFIKKWSHLFNSDILPLGKGKE